MTSSLCVISDPILLWRKDQVRGPIPLSQAVGRLETCQDPLLIYFSVAAQKLIKREAVCEIKSLVKKNKKYGNFSFSTF